MIDFIYTIDPNSNKPVMLLNDVIGDFGINGGQFQKELLYLDTLGKDCIEIMINSPGGSVFDGFSIASAILNCKTRVITNNVGIAGSIAAVIYMCAKERYMADYALMMVHNVNGGNEKARMEFNNSISMLLSKNSSLSQDQVKILMMQETWMNYDECMKNGFCNTYEEDEYSQNSEGVVFNKNAYEDVFAYANQIIKSIDMKKAKIENNIVQPEDTTIPEDSLETIEVVIDSTETEEETIEETVEEDIVETVDELENKIDEVSELRKALEDSNALVNQLKDELTKIKETEIEKNITNFINSNIEMGKITNESKDKWFDLCKTNFESAKDLINSLSINKEAPKIENNIRTNNKSPRGLMDFINFNKK